jgi:hypothetical protein
MSETQDKYTTPSMDNSLQAQRISTQELQKSHYVFGTNKDPWNTTNQSTYGPKVE